MEPIMKSDRPVQVKVKIVSRRNGVIMGNVHDDNMPVDEFFKRYPKPFFANDKTELKLGEKITSPVSKVKFVGYYINYQHGTVEVHIEV